MRELLEIPDPRLRQKSKPIKIIDGYVKDLADFLLVELTRTHRGLTPAGLAAPQYGELVRIIAFRWDTQTKRVIINPEIIKAKGVSKDTEQCLSVPYRVCLIERPKIVKVRGIDLAGNQMTIKAHDMVGRVICHEIDHLDGILITDRATA